MQRKAQARSALAQALMGIQGGDFASYYLAALYQSEQRRRLPSSG